MKETNTQQKESKASKWGKIILGMCIGGFTLGLPLLIYQGCRNVWPRFFGKELPEIDSWIKKGTLVGLAVVASVFGTMFSGGFAAPAIPAIIAGAVTTVAGVTSITLSGDAPLEKRVVEQQKKIEELSRVVNRIKDQDVPVVSKGSDLGEEREVVVQESKYKRLPAAQRTKRLNDESR